MADLSGLALWGVAGAALLLAIVAAKRDLGVRFVIAAPAVMAAAGALCGAMLVGGVPLGAAITMAALLIVCSLIAEIDRRHLIIPDPLVLAVVLLAMTSPFAPPWMDKLIGAGLLAGFFLAVRWAFARAGRDRALGLGDVKLAGAIGAMVGAQDGLIAVAIAGIATLCGMLWSTRRGGAIADTTAPFGIGLAAALSAMSALRIWSGA